MIILSHLYDDWKKEQMFLPMMIRMMKILRKILILMMMLKM